jgi:hypothetical protein
VKGIVTGEGPKFVPPFSFKRERRRGEKRETPLCSQVFESFRLPDNPSEHKKRDRRLMPAGPNPKRQ